MCVVCLVETVCVSGAPAFSCVRLERASAEGVARGRSDRKIVVGGRRGAKRQLHLLPRLERLEPEDVGRLRVAVLARCLAGVDAARAEVARYMDAGREGVLPRVLIDQGARDGAAKEAVGLVSANLGEDRVGRVARQEIDLGMVDDSGDGGMKRGEQRQRALASPHHFPRLEDDPPVEKGQGSLPTWPGLWRAHQCL